MTKQEQVRQFMKWYDGNLGVTDSGAQAYSLTESIWKAEYGVRFYKDYGSFRACRSYYMKHTKPSRPRLGPRSGI